MLSKYDKIVSKKYYDGIKIEKLEKLKFLRKRITIYQRRQDKKRTFRAFATRAKNGDTADFGLVSYL